MMKKISEDEKSIAFEVKGTDNYFLNTIRRYVMGRIPVMAIDRVVFYDNNSAYWDEYIAHRIGLIPLKTPQAVKEDTEVIFTLDVEGPAKIYSSELKSEDKEIEPAIKEIPLITLKEGQRVKLEGFAKAGKGRTHAKYQAALMSFSEKKKGVYSVYVESFYQMSPKEAVKRACEEIVKDIKAIVKAIK